MSNPSPTTPGTPRRTQVFIIALLLIVAVVLGALILRSQPSGPAAQSHGPEEAAPAEEGDGHGHAAGEGDSAHGKASAPQGPHGGELFTQNDFTLELRLTEQGGEPRFQAWLAEKGQPLAPAGTRVALSLARPNGDVQEIALLPQAGVWTSAQTVDEPHVFAATAAVQTPTAPYSFTFTRSEGLIAMADAQIEAASITLDTSTPATLRSALQFPGEIKLNEDRTAHVVPRAGGVVESVSAQLGQQVKKGQVLAVISSAAVSEARAELQTAQRRRDLAKTTHAREHSLWQQKISPEQDVLQARQAWQEAEITVTNALQKLRVLGASPGSASLGRLELRAPFAAMVVEKHIALGEAVKEDANVFTLSDLSSVWAELSVSARDLPQVRVGERVVVRAGASEGVANGVIAYVGSLIGEQTRTAQARVELANPQGAWRPGLYVTVEVLAPEKSFPVTVEAAALQTVDGQPVVFLKVPGGFVPQPVQTGRSDGKRVEIVQGLQPGARYAAAGSFVVKSEQGKSSATHTH